MKGKSLQFSFMSLVYEEVVDTCLQQFIAIMKKILNLMTLSLENSKLISKFVLSYFAVVSFSTVHELKCVGIFVFQSSDVTETHREAIPGRETAFVLYCI